MKKSVPISYSRSRKTTAPKGKTGVRSRSLKNYAKKSLRSILLSHTFHTGFKVVMAVALVSFPLYGVYAHFEKSMANEVVISQSEILERVGRHMDLPDGTPQAMVRVQEAESLRKQADFYAEIKPGDYIIMYPSLAIIYDLRNDRIVATKNLIARTR